MKSVFRLLLVLACFPLAGCDSPETTIGRARKQLSEFQAHPDDAHQAAVEASLQRLDSQIAALEAKGETAEADRYRRQAGSLHAEFQAARLARAVNDGARAIQSIGDALKDAGKSFSDTLDQASKETNAP